MKNWQANIENFFGKIEGFFTNVNFIAKLTTALSVATKALNDSLMGRNKEALKTYLAARDGASAEEKGA